MPNVPLILTHKGARYELSVKRRVNCDGETVQLLLGHVHLDHVAPYLEVSKSARREAMADLGGVFAEGCD
ncbi:hypothetical protein [Burkholderia ubonensis]|uniref:hypothetical protein n=1 Tax=Burkholderia ubonensis TaxID=101571 RepID=UPI000AFC908A|nr:hypothetical protein [Burkholderia ubonensis]